MAETVDPNAHKTPFSKSEKNDCCSCSNMGKPTDISEREKESWVCNKGQPLFYERKSGKDKDTVCPFWQQK